jgi:hypothetical protein
MILISTAGWFRELMAAIIASAQPDVSHLRTISSLCCTAGFAGV